MHVLSCCSQFTLEQGQPFSATKLRNRCLVAATPKQAELLQAAMLPEARLHSLAWHYRHAKAVDGTDWQRLHQLLQALPVALQ